MKLKVIGRVVTAEKDPRRGNWHIANPVVSGIVTTLLLIQSVTGLPFVKPLEEK